MLQLKRVEIQGFKSFCERAEMRLPGSGIAVVVGPNGCGKSNLSDAISWVLGEQSAKSLRGARMEDVIFAGTRERKPVGMASVTMTLVDPKTEAPIVLGEAGGPPDGDGAHKPAKPEEITITRRLFRSGDSEYLINGRTARLRDIQDLFMGTGLGPESYAIIEQGRIGQILSNRPQDRRAIIEEAAGITRFRTKRRLAETKLEGAKQNLTRVFDILEEVGRQVTTLKRQAAKAKRFEELKAELAGHLRIALVGRFALLEREATRVALDLNLATKAWQELGATVGRLDLEQATLREQCFTTEAELTEARKGLSERRLDAERTRGRLESQGKQIETIEQRLLQDETEGTHVAARLASLSEELQGHGTSVAELDAQADAARGRLAACERQRNELQQSLAGRERAIEQGRQAVIRLMGEASTLRNQLAQLDEFLSSVDRDLARSLREEEAAAADLTRLTSVKKDISERRAARQLELLTTTEQRRVVSEDISVRRTQLAETRRRLDAMRNEANRLKARRDSLEEILTHHSYATGAVKRLFTAVEKGQVTDLPLAGVLADFIDVDAAYEKPVEEFLHDELEFIVVDSWVAAERGIELMRTQLDGRATFLVRADGVEADASPGLHAEPGVLARLTDVLRATGGLAPSALTQVARIANCYLVEDREAGQRLSMRHPHLQFLAPDGLCYHGRGVSGGKRGASGPLALKRESRELAAALEERLREVERLGALLEQIEGEAAQLNDESERLRGLQQTQEKESFALDVEMRKLGEELSRTNSRLSVARLELQRLRLQSEKSREQRERNQELAEQKEEARRAQEGALLASREQLEELQRQSVTVGEEHAALRVDVAGLEERRRAGRAAHARLEQQVKETTARRDELAREMQRLSADRTRLDADNRELEARSLALSGEISRLDQAVARLAEQEHLFRGRLTAVDASLKQARAQFQEAQDRKGGLDVELVKCRSGLQYLQETCLRDLQTTVEELASGEQTVPEEELIQEAERRSQEVRGRIENLGPVNPAALEEFQEAQQRHDFLSVQRQDLIDSIRDTEKAIREIDVESRRRFGEAFGAINAHFRELFSALFNGGVGEMRLTDEDNQLESGIDIVAQPPNKKLQSVLLLSGGEKALTAMALLMAIFRYQPSPFCILDEVDAPLDEPNTERLVRLLREMSAQTQFVVITHARRTMEAAEALYGVTMQEPGVSKLVSVRFNAADAPALPPPAAGTTPLSASVN